MRLSFASKVGDHSWAESVQGAIATWSTIGVKNRQEYRTLITDQVAIAPCTDSAQDDFLTFEANPCGPRPPRLPIDAANRNVHDATDFIAL